MIDLSICGAIPRPLTERMLRKAVEQTFQGARKKPDGEISLVFLSSERIRQLNTRWRQKDSPTDVLSFSPALMPGFPKEKRRYYGDLFLCSSFIRTSAKEQGRAFQEELLRVTIHGVLHLFGYDHLKLADEKKMFALQERILKKVS